MVHLSVLFWILEVLFGFIGALRGWAKELLVTFSLLVALMIINLIEEVNYLQNIQAFENIIRAPDETTPYGAAALRLVENLPPRFLGVPWLYVVVTAAFVFVLVVFI